MDLSDWVYCASNGLELVGKAKGRVLSPVLQLVRPFVPTPQGEIGMALKLFPFLGIGLRSLTVPEGSVFVALEAFGQGNEQNWSKIIEAALQLDTRVRTEALGLVRAVQ